MSTPSSRADLPVRCEAGLQLVDSVLWLDTPRPRELSFLSHAGIRPLPSEQRLLTTPETLGLLGEPQNAGTLPCPFFRPFALGSLELELSPAGYLPGSAQLLVTRDGLRIGYLRDLGHKANRCSRPARVRRCDLLVLDGASWTDEPDLPPRDQVEETLVELLREACAAGEMTGLLVARLGAAMELAALLSEESLQLRAHPALLRTARRYGERASELSLRPVGQQVPPGEVLLWPSDLRESPVLQRFGRSLRLIEVGPEATTRPPVRPGGLAPVVPVHGPRSLGHMPLSLRAPLRDLLSLVDAAQPELVVVYRPAGVRLTRTLAERGHEVVELREPEQQQLLP